MANGRPSFQLNPLVAAFRCLRCDLRLPIGDYFEGCPACHATGSPASVAPVYQRLPDAAAPRADGPTRSHSERLIYRCWPSLGEGRTPLICVPRLAAALGTKALYVKFEGANPTGSHKDRMSMLVVARAIDVGAETVVVASSGNAGASLAAYAAAAGLECTIVSTPRMHPGWRRAIEMHGARLVATPDSLSRWDYVRARVRQDGWYPATNFILPAVGSNPFGVDGYRAIAFELHDEMGADRIDHVVVPTSRGDVLWGIARGFKDLEVAGATGRSPKVHAVEPFGRIQRVLDGSRLTEAFPGETAMTSIAGSTVTFQSLDALRLCGGAVAVIDDARAQWSQRQLAGQGVYLELSSAATLAAARDLKHRNLIGEGDSVVLLGTSHGYKDTPACEDSVCPAA